MFYMSKLKKYLLFLFGCLLIYASNAQINSSISSSPRKFIAKGDIFGTRVFIKNIGQFDNVLPDNTKVIYAYVSGSEKVFFTNKGVIYLFEDRPKLSEHDREEMEHDKNYVPKSPKTYSVNVHWPNCNPVLNIQEDFKTSHYHTYGTLKEKAECFEKITYKNVYPNIDLEYLLPSLRNNGLKYTFIVHPGGNTEDIKIKYSGDVKKIALQPESGNILVKTPILSFSELAPASFQFENGLSPARKLASNFVLKNNIISFNFPNGYNKNADLIIDPWVVNLTTLIPTNANSGFDVDFDYVGNYFVYGGDFIPQKVAKYDVTGNLLWTFNGVPPIANWNTFSYSGNFLVDKASGKVYVSEGFSPTIGIRMIRLNQSGVYDNFVSIPSVSWNEIWDMGYDCANGTIFALGGSVASNQSAGTLNTTTGAITPQTFTPFGTAAQDIVSHAIDPSGNIFFIFASFGTPFLNNRLMRANATFNGSTWIQPSTFTSFNESLNKNYPGSSTSSNGYNALAANANYLYYYDGQSVAAYNKLTGAIIASAFVPSLSLLQQGGIAVDDCDNLYLGGEDNIVCYNFNGTAFVPNGNIPLNVGSGFAHVTDIKYFLSSNQLYVSGIGFGGMVDAINSTNCVVFKVGVTTPCSSNNLGLAVVTCTTGILNPVLTFSLTNSVGLTSVQTNSVGSLTNTISNLPAGTYTLLTQVNAPCGPIRRDVFVIDPFPLFSISISSITCNGSSNGSVIITDTSAVPSVLSYSWVATPLAALSPAPQQSNLPPGTYTCIITDSKSCTDTIIATILQPSALSLSVSANNTIVCVNDRALLSSSLSGGVGAPYTYTWSTGIITNTSVVTQISGGQYNYSLTAFDANLCPVSAVQTLSFVNYPILLVSDSSIICEGESINLTANGAETYTWLPGNPLSPTLGNGVTVSPSTSIDYTIVAENYTCRSSANVYVDVVPFPNFTLFSPKQFLCKGESTFISATGTAASNYSWSPANTLSANNLPLVIAAPLVSTNYTVTGYNVKDTLFCGHTQAIDIVVIPKVLASVSNSIAVCLGEQAVLSASGGNTYSWSPATSLNISNQSQALAQPKVSTIYTVNISNNGVCGDSAMVMVVVNPNPSVNAGRDTIFNLDEAMSLNASGTGTLTWIDGENIFCRVCPETQIKATRTGCYYIETLNEFGCKANDDVCVTVTGNFEVYIPNSFTPNADGLNDEFKVYGHSISDVRLEVFDRWGENIYTSAGGDVAWNGIYQGELCQQGVYVYKVSYKTLDFKTENKVGHISLIR
jgi:gliding motility-associated-like protein